MLQINLIALGVRKWIWDKKKISFTAYLIVNDEEKTLHFDSSILKPGEMINNFMAKLDKAVSNEMQKPQDGEEIRLDFDNETFLKQRLLHYFKKINTELRGGKNRTSHRKIQTTHFDIYDESTDISILPKNIQFYVMLNRCKKYYNREEYKKAIDPLRRLLKINPQYGLGYKWLARSLKKNRKYEEAMRYYQKYAEVDGSIDSLLDLAKSHRKGKIFDKSEEIYQKILEKEPKNKAARFGLAQIKYALKEDEYLAILDELFEDEPAWLKKWLVDEFNFRIYIPEKIFITPAQAAKFLGYKNVFELTQRAFKNEIPSHFNPAKARLSFYKEELENWAGVMNRFNCVEEKIQLYPENLNGKATHMDANGAAEKPIESKNGRKPAEDNSTRVEEILKQIRARKAERAAEQANENWTKEKKMPPENDDEEKQKNRRKISRKKTEKSNI